MGEVRTKPKKYVFGTGRLVEIRGASGLLVDLNESDTREFLQRELGKTNFDEVFLGGGTGQFIARVGRDVLDACMIGLQKIYADASKGGLNLLYGIAEYTGENFSGLLAKAHLDLKQKKEEESVVSQSMLHTGFIRECDSCAEMASAFSIYAGEERVLCPICATKVEQGKKKGLWKKYAQFVDEKSGEKITDDMMPVTFEEIGERCEIKRGYTALVYADGNAMGKLIKTIETKEQFQYFSQTVDQAVKRACHEALYANCREVDRKIPASILLLGGDDLLVYMAADSAFPFAIDAAQRFADYTKSEFQSDPFFNGILKGEGLTISLGIAYGKSHTPFSIMFGQAEELLKSSKKAGSEDKRGQKNENPYYSPTYIDYHISSQFNQIRVSDSRNNHLQLAKPVPVQLYQKPP